MRWPTTTIYYCNGDVSCSQYHGPYSKVVERNDGCSGTPELKNYMYDNNVEVARDNAAHKRGDVNPFFDMSSWVFDKSSMDNWCTYIDTGTLSADYADACPGVDALA